MVAIAIFSADPAMRRSLEQLLREHSTFSIVGVVGDPALLVPALNRAKLNFEQGHWADAMGVGGGASGGQRRR
jgi:hypothetical protein